MYVLYKRFSLPVVKQVKLSWQSILIINSGSEQATRGRYRKTLKLNSTALTPAFRLNGLKPRALGSLCLYRINKLVLQKCIAIEIMSYSNNCSSRLITKVLITLSNVSVSYTETIFKD